MIKLDRFFYQVFHANDFKLAVGPFSIELRDILLRSFDCCYMLLASGSTHLLGCPNGSCNWSYLYQENEHHFGFQNAVPVTSNIYGRTGNEVTIPQNL